MRVVLITQDEPLYLAPSVKHLLSRLGDTDVEVVGCVVLDPSPVGTRSGLLTRVRQMANVFGVAFVARYGALQAMERLRPDRALSSILGRYEVKEIRLKANINSRRELERLSTLNPDLLVSIAGNQIFRRKLIGLARHGCLNLHTAMLPQYRGLMPTFWAMKNDERTIGVSVFFVDEGIDTGPIIVQKQVPIATDRLEELIRATKRVGMDAIYEAIMLIRSGSYELLENDPAKGSYYGFPTRDDVREFRRRGKRLF